LPAGPLLRLELSDATNWGLSLIRHTGSKAHLRKLTRVTGSLAAAGETAEIEDSQPYFAE
jgi:hypothetical protein